MSSFMRYIEAGVAFADAVRLELKPQSVAEWAWSIGKHPSNVTGVIRGTTPYPYEEIRDALAERLGVTRAWLDARCPVRANSKRGLKEPVA